MGPTRRLPPCAPERQHIYPSVLSEFGPGSLYLSSTHCSSREATDVPTTKAWHHPHLYDWATVSVISCRLPL